MTDLLDDYSELNRFKRENGLYRDKIPKASGYLLECRLRRKLESASQGIKIYDVAKAAALSEFRIKSILVEILPEYDVESLEKALQICENEGAAQCFQYLHTLKP